MKLLVGLGNPGAKYAGTRHNIGFMAVERIAEAHGFSPWRSRFQGLLAEGVLGGQKVAALKPQTFMNLSGQSVGEALRFWKLAPEEVIVFHDEMDLAPLKVRLKEGGGHAGHNGLRSLHQHIGPDYQRVRLGIGHPGRKEQVLGWVLSEFPRPQAEALQALLDGIARGAPYLVNGEGSKFQNALAQSAAGAEPGGQGAAEAPAAGRRSPPQAESRAGGEAGSAVKRLPRPTETPAEASANPPPGPLQRLLDRFR